MPSTRRLAAILAADVAGYSRLMGEDEEGTLAALKAIRRELIDPKIKEHYGRIVKTTGDGVLVEFASVVDAVRCAVDIQRDMALRNAGAPDAKRNFGFDAQSGEYKDMVAAGIIDPTKVVRVALQDAASVAGLLITTEAMVGDRPEPKGAPGMPPGGMGGMDY